MEILNKINSFAWGPIMIVFLVGTGLFLSIGTKLVQYRKLGKSFKLLFSKPTDADGDITPLQSLTTALSATIGTGNIAGVAAAIALGGPGAVFWMWITAIVGGATKFAEAVLAMEYRTTNEKGEKSGGPMYYASVGMRDKFGGNWKWLGWLFALFGFFASFGIGNMVQSNSVAQALKSSFNLSPAITGIALAVLTALVIVGGISSIGKVTEKLIPTMAAVYVAAALFILFANANAIPSAFGMIFSNAFSGQAVAGGFVGAVMRYGIARGVFSNEAGLGSAAIAHAASQQNDPVKQGLIASLGCVIDTLIVCSMTALVILVSGYVTIGTDGLMSIKDGLSGAALTTQSFEAAFSGGGIVVTIGLIFFAFSTIIGWYYYGSKCLEFIAGVGIAELYKWVFIALVFLGAVFKNGFVWNLSDTLNGLMALPNLIAILALSPIVFKFLKKYENKKDGI